MKLRWVLGFVLFCLLGWQWRAFQLHRYQGELDIKTQSDREIVTRVGMIDELNRRQKAWEWTLASGAPIFLIVSLVTTRKKPQKF